jgi:hypothetical protein
VENQEEPRLEEFIDPAIVAILDKAREIGMNLLNNACNSMIENFRSIKWLFHELEDVKEKVGQLEGARNLKGLEKGTDQEDSYSLMERSIHNLENYNHNVSSQMIFLLNVINNKILSITDWLKDRGLQGDVDDKDRVKSRSKDDNTTGIIFSTQDQEDHKT